MYIYNIYTCEYFPDTLYRKVSFANWKKYMAQIETTNFLDAHVYRIKSDLLKYAQSNTFLYAVYPKRVVGKKIKISYLNYFLNSFSQKFNHYFQKIY